MEYFAKAVENSNPENIRAKFRKKESASHNMIHVEKPFFPRRPKNQGFELRKMGKYGEAVGLWPALYN